MRYELKVILEDMASLIESEENKKDFAALLLDLERKLERAREDQEDEIRDEIEYAVEARLRTAFAEGLHETFNAWMQDTWHDLAPANDRYSPWYLGAGLWRALADVDPATWLWETVT